MDEIVRRSQLRKPCDEPVEVYAVATGIVIAEARMLDVSLSGCRIRLSRELKAGMRCHLRLKGPEGSFDLSFRVMREAPRADDADGRIYGLAFDLDGDGLKQLRRFVNKLK